MSEDTDNQTISQAMRLLALRRAAKLSPERRSEIARKAGKATAGKPRKRKPKPPDNPPLEKPNNA